MANEGKRNAASQHLQTSTWVIRHVCGDFACNGDWRGTVVVRMMGLRTNKTTSVVLTKQALSLSRADSTRLLSGIRIRCNHDFISDWRVPYGFGG